VDKDCGDYSDGDLQRFFRAHPCISHYRTLIECAEENYVIRFSIATRKMRRRWLALLVLCLGSLMIVLDGTIVNVALPSIRADLGFSETSCLTMTLQ
jgi:hypothetical protein